MAGYAAVSSGRVYSIDFYTLPRPDKLALSISLLQMCEARAKELQAQKVMTFLPHVNQVDRQAVEAAGFKAERYHFRMQIEFDAPPPAPKWPEGIELCTIAPGQDDRRVYDFIQEAFERPGRTPPPFEQWRDFMMRPDHFSPKLWWLAFYQGKLVGANLCFDYPQHGWVRQLGVAPPLRKQGLGGALLLHCFGVFYARGHKQVALGVDSENERAVHFYEGVGMHCVRQYDEYHKSFGIDE